MVLIVDDFADGAEGLCKLLQKMGYACRWVGGGPEAIAAVRQQPPEMPLLVVLDEMMPQMTGMEVVATLRGDPATAHTPIIMFSASFDIVKREAAMSLGVLDWMIKGHDVMTAVGTIVQHYERIGGAKTLQPSPTSTASKQQS